MKNRTIANRGILGIDAATWAAAVAAVGSALLFAKKFIARRHPPKPDLITRTEFHAGMDAVRDRIGASYLAMADKLDANHKEIMSALDRQVTRINDLETGLARVDERTEVSASLAAP